MILNLESQLQRWPYRGWLVLGGAFLTSTMMVGATHYSFGLISVPAGQSLGLSRAETNNALIAMGIGSAVLSPLIGRLLDRVPIPFVMAVGGALLGLGLLTISLTSLPWLILLMALLPIAIGGDCAGGLSANVLAVRWFVRRRGRALGIIAISSSMGGFLIAPLTAYLIGIFGWRTALGILGVAAMLVTFVVAVFLVRSRPTEAALREAGELVRLGEGSELQTEQRTWSYRELIRNRNFFLIVIGASLLLASDRAILISVAPYLTDAGLSLQQAGLMISALTGTAIVGKLIVGYLGEYVDPRKLFLVVAALHIALLAMLIVQPAFPVMIALSLAVGLGMGGVLPVKQMLLAGAFGSKSYGVVLGLSTVILQTLMVIALRFIGEVRDRTSSYDVGFQTFIAVVVISAILIWMVRYRGDAVPKAAKK